MSSQRSNAQSELKRLSFNQKLVSSTSKPIQTADLFKRLKTLHNELSSADQGEIDASSLAGITGDLVHTSLMSHKDKGVKSLVACSIADLLRLHAPDAPYDEPKLRDVFDFFIRQLRNLSEQQSPYYTYYFYLLQSLSSVKSVVLVSDLSNSSDLIVSIFELFFDVISPQHVRDVQIFMLDIMAQLVDECAPLPQRVIDIILTQFLKSNQNKNPTAFQMAIELCRVNTDLLQRYVCQYFSEAILAASRTSSTDTDELSDFRTAHDLIREIHKTVPGLLLNVIPQLEEELNLDELSLRILATQALGDMFTEQRSNLITQYPAIWKAWVGRRIDKAPSVRIALLAFCGNILKNHPAECKDDMNETFLMKLQDPDEKVRSEACKVIGQIEYEDVLKAINKEILSALSQRCKDKKYNVQVEAFTALANLYDLAYTEMLDQKNEVIDKFGWIPTDLINTIYVDNPSTIALLERILHEKILPPNNDDAARTERLAIVYNGLDPKAKTGFLWLLQRQKQTIEDMNVFLDLCEAQNDGDMMQSDELDMTTKIKNISTKLPESTKAMGHLSEFVKLHDARLYKLLRKCMELETDYKTVRKTAKDAQKRIEQISASMSETFSIIIRRISVQIINKNSVPQLLKKMSISEGENPAGSTREIFKVIASTFPAILQTHLHELIKLLQDEKDDTIVSDSLGALTQFAIHFADKMPQDAKMKKSLIQYALKGSPSQAKSATIVLAHIPDKQSACSELFKHIRSLSVSNQQLLTHLVVLSQLVRYQPQVVEDRIETVLEFVKDLVMDDIYEAKNLDHDWIDYDKLPDKLKAKLLGINVFVNRLIAFEKDDSAKSLAEPVFEILLHFLRQKDDPGKKAMQAQLRAKAVRSILKLVKYRPYEEMVTTPLFEELALTIQDECTEVRQLFVQSLLKYLGTRKLHVRYLTVLTIGAHEPNHQLKDKIEAFMARQAKTLDATNGPVFELLTARLIHLLAHHPDFSTSDEEIHRLETYVMFFLDCIANAENISFLNYIALQVKISKDAVSPPLDENLYFLSDLIQRIIRWKCKNSSWPLTTYAGQIQLSVEFSDLYQSLPVAKHTENLNKLYIPADYTPNAEHKPSNERKKAGQNKKTRARSQSPNPTSNQKKRKSTSSEQSIRKVHMQLDVD